MRRRERIMPKESNSFGQVLEYVPSVKNGHKADKHTGTRLMKCKRKTRTESVFNGFEKIYM